MRLLLFNSLFTSRIAYVANCWHLLLRGRADTLRQFFYTKLHHHQCSVGVWNPKNCKFYKFGEFGSRTGVPFARFLRNVQDLNGPSHAAFIVLISNVEIVGFYLVIKISSTNSKLPQPTNLHMQDIISVQPSRSIRFTHHVTLARPQTSSSFLSICFTLCLYHNSMCFSIQLHLNLSLSC